MALRSKTRLTQRFGSKRITTSTIEPVTLEETKDYLRITGSESDRLIVPLIMQAREIIEQQSSIAFINQTWRYTLDDWGNGQRDDWWDGTRQGYIGELYGATSSIEFPRYPLSSVTSVTVYDNASVSSTVDVAATFDIDTDSIRGRMSLKTGKTWPVALRRTNAIEILYVAGHGLGANDVPQPLKRALFALIAHLYEHRGNCRMTEAYEKSGARDIIRLYAPVRF